MQTERDRPEAPTAIRNHLDAIFVSLELSRSTWLITSLSPGGGEKVSKKSVRGGDVAGLLERFAQLRKKAHARTGRNFPIIVIQEAGLDGFWIHRMLQNEGIESHVVDPASIAISRRRRRAKTDGIDGEALLRTLLAYKRGEPRVCAMVKVPTAEEEDRRRRPPQAGYWCSRGERRPNVITWPEAKRHEVQQAIQVLERTSSASCIRSPQWSAATRSGGGPRPRPEKLRLGVTGF